MAVIYTWTIANMERNTADDGVTVCHWRCEGVDGDHSASSYGTTSHTPDPSDAGFVAYADLTEATVLGWVHASVDKDATEAAIADKINALANPTTAAGTPWAA
ncbi:hypothetical protein CRP5_gp53 [Roseobacter phage CRP-5]|uniref:DUF7936 domain-containing protein n=1 Tax=Roseobacter phage CRP-5 TaxID=2559284 RepID=A0A646QWE2_9CAUD|nr:hypothetical protein CRP5_gp53 [Roseobacter phage CRP-5]